MVDNIQHRKTNIEQEDTRCSGWVNSPALFVSFGCKRTLKKYIWKYILHLFVVSSLAMVIRNATKVRKKPPTIVVNQQGNRKLTRWIKSEEHNIFIPEYKWGHRVWEVHTHSTVKATYKFVFDSNTKGTINGAETTYHSGTSELTPGI